MNYIKILCLTILSSGLFAQKTQQIRINISDAQSNLVVENCEVKIDKYNLTTNSNEKGQAIFEKVPVGRLEIEIRHVGYNPILIKELLLISAKALVLDVKLEPNLKKLPELKITVASPNLSGALMGIHQFTTEQIFRFPATFFDPARLAFSYPGVTNTNDQANGMSVRGNSPDGLQWRLEGVEIVNPNHLSNAGTGSDKATSTAGGTNIMSAQMLGNMNFLTGPFPAEYANAQAGVMDMRFRTGNNKNFENTAQVGLLGIDLASEGPINKKTGSSYLVNYRYSFTGLLGLMGISFGGEKIKFQDLAINLNFPTQKLGTFSFFMMGGNSSNIFVPDANKANWTSEKDLNNIDFYSKMGVIGIKNQILLKKRWFWQTILANSGLENLRNAYTTSPKYNVDYDFAARNLISGSSSISGKIFNNLNLKTGVNITQNYSKYNVLNFDNKFYSFSNITYQPYAKISNNSDNKISYNIGIQGVYYANRSKAYFEPRIAAAYRISPNTKIKLAYGLYSQQLNSRYALYNWAERSHQLSLGTATKLNNNAELTFEAYYQSIFNLPISSNNYESVLNSFDRSSTAVLVNVNGQMARNYGIEANCKKLLTRGFFAMLNTSIYKAEFKAFDNKYYQTRFSGNYISNITVGKEWEKSNGKILGINTRIVWMGGYRDYNLQNYTITNSSNFAFYDYSKALVKKNPDFIRPDLRIYLKNSKTKNARTISLDIQNFINRQNYAYQYFDSYKNNIVTKYQLGIIPMFNYRFEF